MKDMNFNTTYKILAVCAVFVTAAACEKPNEVPPHSQAFIRQYVIPPPTLISVAERDLVNQQREEYNKL